MELKDKFNMTSEQNVFLAKRNIVDYIWKSANLEGIPITFPETEAVYEGMSISGFKVQEILAINNLKRTWNFILETLNYPTNYQLICKINQIVGEGGLFEKPGFIRKLSVRISGTKWKPEVPIEYQIKEDLAKIENIKSITDRAITLMLYIMRKQMFMDGNKRTAMFSANHMLISNGKGIITISQDIKQEFGKLLIDFYETNNIKQIKEFIYDLCLEGLDYPEGDTTEYFYKLPLDDSFPNW